MKLPGMRADEVYRELLPSLCRVARQSGRGVIIKLHPFESLSQRVAMVRDILTPEDRNLVNVVDGPLTSALLAQAWFGITVESTTVIDCLRNGICCFLCGWMSLSPYEYPQQYRPIWDRRGAAGRTAAFGDSEPAGGISESAADTVESLGDRRSSDAATVVDQIARCG